MTVKSKKMKEYFTLQRFKEFRAIIDDLEKKVKSGEIKLNKNALHIKDEPIIIAGKCGVYNDWSK